MTGFIITKYHELIRFFIKNLTRMSLKLEKPEKIRISFKCYFFLFFGILRIPTACLWLPICLNMSFSPISRPSHVVHHWRGNFYFIPPQGTYFNPIFPLCSQRYGLEENCMYIYKEAGQKLFGIQ